MFIKVTSYLLDDHYLMAKTVSKNYTTVILLVFFAACLQSVSCISCAEINSFLKISGENIGVLFSPIKICKKHWLIATLLGRVLGVYLFGKHAYKYGFFKTIYLVSVLFVTVHIIFALLCLTYSYNYQKPIMFSTLRGIYCVLQSAAIMLPSIFLFRISPFTKHINISALLIITVFSEGFFSHYLGLIIPISLKIWLMLPIITALIAWALYYYVEKISEQPKHIVKAAKLPLKTKIQSAILGSGCATVLYYNSSFFAGYVKNVSILDPDKIFSDLKYFCLCGFLLFPCAKLTERFGFYKIGLISSAGLFVLTIKNGVFTNSAYGYFAHKTLFAFFSSLFIAPLFALLYKFFKPHPTPYQYLVWFAFGMNFCMILAFFEKSISIQTGLNLGWWVFNISIASCFITILKLGKSIDYKKSSLSNHDNTVETSEKIVMSS